MIFEIKHNPEEYQRMCIANWRLVMRKRTESQILVIILGLLLIFFAYLNNSGQFVADDLMFAGGMFFLLVSLNYFRHFSTVTKKRKKAVEERSTKLMDTTFTLEFTESKLIYKDAELDISMPWGYFDKFFFYKGALMIRQKNHELATYFISEKEVGSEKIKEMMAFLKTKIK